MLANEVSVTTYVDARDMDCTLALNVTHQLRATAYFGGIGIIIWT